MRYKAIDVRAAPLHTGEVAGSIPAAPTIFREFAGGSRQNVTQNAPLRSPWTLFPACIAQSLCHAGFLGRRAQSFGQEFAQRSRLHESAAAGVHGMIVGQ